MSNEKVEVMTNIQLKNDNLKREIEDYIALCNGELENIEDGGTLKAKTKYLSNTIEYRVRVKVAELLRKDRTLPNDVTLQMSADDIMSLYNGYLELISYINSAISYTPNKLEFLAYARISVSAFSHLLEDTGREDVAQVCGDIEADLINFTLSAAEEGQTKESTSKLRLKAKGGYGHSLVEIGDAESVIDKAADAMNVGAYRAELKNIASMKALIDKKGDK